MFSLFKKKKNGPQQDKNGQVNLGTHALSAAEVKKRMNEGLTHQEHKLAKAKSISAFEQQKKELGLDDDPEMALAIAESLKQGNIDEQKRAQKLAGYSQQKYRENMMQKASFYIDDNGSMSL